MSLIFVDDSLPGLTRRMWRGKWAYFDVAGQRITDGEEVARLNAIALPPAYSDAWFAPAGNAHILATGFDAKGRKQYRYHPGFRAERDAAKFDGCVQFGRLLPLIRARVESDLAHRRLDADRAIASIVRLLDSGGIRIGNEAYVAANNSYGATTLRMRHARLRGETLHLSFQAKSGKARAMRVTDRGLARFVRKVQDLPGQHLFRYVADDGSVHPVNSCDVNTYIRETMGSDFTAKHFRTWVASALAFRTLHEAGEAVPLKHLLTTVADRLGNTPAIARASYIHPAVLSAAEAEAHAALRDLRLPRATRWLERHERGLIAYLDQHPSMAEMLAAA